MGRRDDREEDELVPVVPSAMSRWICALILSVVRETREEAIGVSSSWRRSAASLRSCKSRSVFGLLGGDGGHESSLSYGSLMGSSSLLSCKMGSKSSLYVGSDS